MASNAANRLLMLLALIFSAHCWGHEGRPVYILIEEGSAGGFDLQWRIPPVLEAGKEPRISLIAEHCQALSGTARARLTGRKHYQCQVHKESAEPIVVALDYPRDNPALSTLIQVRRLNGESYHRFQGPDELRITLPGPMSGWEVARQYILTGCEHILDGYDHLLFVLCLMQLAGGLRRLLITITGFTLAHSVTLGLATLGIWHVRTDLVEVLIALSIVMLAAEIVRAARSTGDYSTFAWRHPAAVAVIFGLLHGFGFASALGELGLPQSMKMTALGFFNLGVELGQLLFVGAVISVLAIGTALVRLWKPVAAPQSDTHARRVPALPWQFIYLAGAVGAYWFVERLLGLF